MSLPLQMLPQGMHAKCDSIFKRPTISPLVLGPSLQGYSRLGALGMTVTFTACRT